MNADEYVVLGCGGRDGGDWRLVLRTMDAIHAKRRITKIVHGDADGYDQLVRAWAELQSQIANPTKIEIVAKPAEWKKYGRAAGPIRNQGMLDEQRPDLVVAFPGGFGTADMVRRARKAGIEVIDVEFREDTNTLK